MAAYASWNNTAVGSYALSGLFYGGFNTGVGTRALRNDTLAFFSTAIGNGTLSYSQGSFKNTAVGHGSQPFGFYTANNTSVGADSLSVNAGNYNTALGQGALFSNSTGSYNVALGHGAGGYLGDVITPTTTMSHNIFVGNGGGPDEAHVIRLGTAFDDQSDADPTNDIGQNKTFVAGIVGATGGDFSVGVCTDGITHQLGPCGISSRQFKENVRDLGDRSARLLGLRPVAFRYREGVRREPRAVEYGLIAEEVAEVYPELVVYDEEGKPTTVKYHLLSTLLLNELQKQATEIQRMRARLERLEAAESPYRRTGLRAPP
jgi:hypothetical protein